MTVASRVTRQCDWRTTQQTLTPVFLNTPSRPTFATYMLWRENAPGILPLIQDTNVYATTSDDGTHYGPKRLRRNDFSCASAMHSDGLSAALAARTAVMMAACGCLLSTPLRGGRTARSRSHRGTTTGSLASLQGGAHQDPALGSSCLQVVHGDA